MRFFLSTDCDRKLPKDEKYFSFPKIEYMHSTHSWWGVLSADGTAADILAAQAKKGLVKEIDEAEFHAWEKKVPGEITPVQCVVPLYGHASAKQPSAPAQTKAPVLSVTASETESEVLSVKPTKGK